MFHFGTYRLLEQGTKFPVSIDLKKTPYALFIGGSGSGKTYALKLFVGKISKYEPTASAWVLDFKGDDDFSFLEGCPRFYRFDSVSEGLDDFYTMFEARQSGEDTDRSPAVLIFDEYAAYINYLEKKAADEAKKKLATLLMMGRSFRCYCVFAVQRADAEIFAKARDNFSLIVAMGNISKESAGMFSFNRDEMIPVTSIGGGHLLTNGTEQAAIQIPGIKDMKKLEAAIKAVVLR